MEYRRDEGKKRAPGDWPPLPRSGKPGAPIPSLRDILHEVALPLPENLDGPEGSRAWVLFSDREWHCSGEESSCGGLTLGDAVLVDIDRDGADELIISLTVNCGGSISLQRLLAYKWQRAEGRFSLLADVDPKAHLCNDADWLADLHAVGRHCVEARRGMVLPRPAVWPGWVRHSPASGDDVLEGLAALAVLADELSCRIAALAAPRDEDLELDVTRTLQADPGLRDAIQVWELVESASGFDLVVGDTRWPLRRDACGLLRRR